MFNKVLIANRGEIACRVTRTARRMGIGVVAVYSDADRDGLHRKIADESVYIGAAPSSESYLCGDKIIRAALEHGASAIHPGYGFLSENAEFARECARHDLVFIGPRPETIKEMGSKSAAKTLMDSAGVPTIPGYQGDDQSGEALMAHAEQIGFPVLLKASAGGGGKGMRLVNSPDEFDSSLVSAKREALASFGDDTMLIEKYLARARHVEVQVFGDKFGNFVHLFERDCSIQRRHQKIIEEAPAPALPPKVRGRLLEAGVAAARAVDYENAGTVEFLYDGDESVFFMEMNTRLQVEHPVTEAITGIDLVEWQFRVANGEALPVAQDQINCNGHAVEARVYAEDPSNHFLPSTGTLSKLSLPTESARIDSGVIEGDDVTTYYDPMIAKITVSGADRDSALHGMSRALSVSRIAGLTTNVSFLKRTVGSKDFLDANFDTTYVDTNELDLVQEADLGWDPYLCALLWAGSESMPAGNKSEASPWEMLRGWRLNQMAEEAYWMDAGGKATLFTVRTEGHSSTVSIDPYATSASRRMDVEPSRPEILTFSGNWDGRRGELTTKAHTRGFDAAPHFEGVRIWIDEGVYDINFSDPLRGEAAHGSAEGSLVAPMPGVIIQLEKSQDDHVSAGETLLVMEAMKMEHAIKAPQDGTVIGFRFKPGDQVKEGDLLVEFEVDS